MIQFLEQNGWALLLIGIIVWGIILYVIISDATEQKKHLKHEMAQTILLMRIAEKLGVEKDRVDDAVREVTEMK